jgi:hypothetical protein
MPTLHIEHAVTDFGTWSTAFSRFAEARQQAGVRQQRVQRPAGDPNYVVIDLDFDSLDEAAGFLSFLQARVWTSSASSPALIGTPQTSILELAEPIS